jgi:hypothetical protein
VRYDPRKGIRYTVCPGDRRPKLKMCNSKLILDSYEHVQVARYDPCTHDESTVTLIKVQSRNAFLRVLFVCVRSYLKSVLSYRFSILDTYHPGILYTVYPYRGRTVPLACVRSYLKSVSSYRFAILGTITQTYYIYVSKDVWIRD